LGSGDDVESEVAASFGPLVVLFGEHGADESDDGLAVGEDPAALLRLAGCVLIEVHDEWQVSDRRYLSEGSMALIDADPTDSKSLEITQEVATTELIAS